MQKYLRSLNGETGCTIFANKDMYIYIYVCMCVYNTKSDSRAYKRLRSFLINQNARFLNEINCNGGGNFLFVYSVFNANKFCLIYLITRSTFVHLSPFPDSEL